MQRKTASPVPVDLGPLTRAAVPLVPLAQRLGLPRPARRKDLELLERDVATHLATQIATSAALAVLGMLFASALTVGGLDIPATYMPLAVVIPVLYGFTAPNQRLKAEAAEHREALRQATGSFLSLTSICLAAGSSLEEALTAAADAGDGPAPRQLRGALAYANAAHTPVWDAFAELGHRADVAELKELAAAVNLAGVEGARLRATLAAKAATLRFRLLSAREATEAATTEKTALPVALLMTGYLLFVVFPAASTALQSLQNSENHRDPLQPGRRRFEPPPPRPAHPRRDH
jgi:Flp pilus assembly protein TadB